jgi:drug efflux transport system permease protein
MRRILRRTGAVAHKEILHMIRDPRVVYLALGLPVVMLLIFGYGISTDIDHIPLAVSDQDQTTASRRLAEDLVAGNEFVLRATLDSPDEAEPLLRKGGAAAVLVVPPGYARDRARGRTGGAQLLVDGSDGTTASIALGDVAGILGPQSPLTGGARVRTRFNPAMRSTYNIVPGVIALILAMVTSMLTGLTVAREWERGSMEQLFATPVGRAEILVGKLLPYAGLGLVQTLLVVVLGSYLFGVPLRGSLLLLFAASSLFLVTMLGVGLVASVVMKKQVTAVQFSLLVSFLPTALLSGFMFPVDNMPLWLQGISMAVPGRYYLVALRGILLKGNGVGVVGGEMLALALFALGTVTLAVVRFRRRLA